MYNHLLNCDVWCISWSWSSPSLNRIPYLVKGRVMGIETRLETEPASVRVKVLLDNRNVELHEYETCYFSEKDANLVFQIIEIMES